jgi:hypothetical protein
MRVTNRHKSRKEGKDKPSGGRELDRGDSPHEFLWGGMRRAREGRRRGDLREE